MRQGLVLVAALGLVACAGTRPAVRPGPPTQLTFSPPPGMMLINRAVEIRIETLEFPKGSARTVRQESHATTKELYEPLPDGSFRVTTTLLDASGSKDNVPLPNKLSLVGISMIHHVDKNGQYIAMENPDEVLEEIRSRLNTPDLRRMVEPLLTRDYVTKPMEASWRLRFARCGKTVQPGAVNYVVDDQPVDEIGPIRSLIRERALGTASTGTRTAMEYDLVVGGRNASFATSPGASEALLPYAEGLRILSEDVRGDGRRLVEVNTCQSYNEEVNIYGEGNLNKNSIDPNRMMLPLKVRYEVHRQILRMTPAEAQALGITSSTARPPPAAPPPATPGT